MLNSRIFYELSRSENYYRYHKPGIHAEYATIEKLPDRRNKKFISVDILVIRFNKQAEMKMSKPCYLCLRAMERKALRSGYRINKVYYSNDEGQIVMQKLKDLIMEEDQHQPFYHRSHRERI